MRISQSTRYATRLMMEIAEVEADVPVSLPAVAQKCSLPLEFLKQLATRLTRAGLLRAYPGRHGGYRLASPANSITVRNIIEAIDGPIMQPANETKPGVSGDLWTELIQEWSVVLDHYSLNELARLFPHLKA